MAVHSIVNEAPCIPCSLRRLTCDGRLPCHACLERSPQQDDRPGPLLRLISKSRRIPHECSYDWTLGPHIYNLFPPFMDWSSKLLMKPRSSMPTWAGGFGSVQKTTTKDRRVVAVKILWNRTEPHRTLQLSLREVWIWSSLSHPNIVPLLGIADLAKAYSGAPKRLCLVSPWILGGSIMEYMQTNADAELDYLVWDVAKGVDYLHHAEGGGLVHGDLKGNNILIDPTAIPRPRALIVDFGLAQVADALGHSENVTTSTSTAGNLRWLAYERLFPEKYGIAHLPLSKTVGSDIFELMRTVLEIFTCQVPFYGETDMAVLRHMDAEEVPTRPSTVWINDALWGLMERAWASDRNDRPSSREVQDALAPSTLTRWINPTPFETLREARSMSDIAAYRSYSRPSTIVSPAEDKVLRLSIATTNRNVSRFRPLLGQLEDWIPRSEWTHVHVEVDGVSQYGSPIYYDDLEYLTEHILFQRLRYLEIRELALESGELYVTI